MRGSVVLLSLVPCVVAAILLAVAVLRLGLLLPLPLLPLLLLLLAAPFGCLSVEAPEKVPRLEEAAAGRLRGEVTVLLLLLLLLLVDELTTVEELRAARVVFAAAGRRSPFSMAGEVEASESAVAVDLP